MTAQLAENEVPARTVLKAAQEALAKALAAADAAAASLARGKETLGELEKRRDAVHAEIADEARTRAEAVEQGNVYAVIGAAAQRRREIDDELTTFQGSIEILIQKNASAQAAIVDAESALASAVKAVIAEEVWPLLSRAQDCENAAAMLRSQLRALQYSGRWGLCPESLPARLAREPANVFHSDQPLNWHQQKVYDRQKAGWCAFADELRSDAAATLSLGD
jgi:hypothetical protein